VGRKNSRDASRGQTIDVVQAAEHGLRNDLPILRFSVWRLDRAWSALTDGAMRTPAIEILHILRQRGPQMALIQNEHVVQTFGSQGLHPAFSDRFGLRRPEWRSDRDDAEAPEPPIKGRPVATVTITYEKARRLSVPTTALEHLSAYPLGCWMTCHAGMENFPTRMMDHEEHIERLEEDRLHAEEVTSPYGRSVLLQERAPTRSRFPIPATTHIFCDTTDRHFEAEPCQLRLDSALAP